MMPARLGPEARFRVVLVRVPEQRSPKKMRNLRLNPNPRVRTTRTTAGPAARAAVVEAAVAEAAVVEAAVAEAAAAEAAAAEAAAAEAEVAVMTVAVAAVTTVATTENGTGLIVCVR